MPNRRMTIALNVLGVIVVGYVILLALLWRFQERIVFQPPANPESLDSANSILEYTSSDGIRLLAYVIEPASSGGPVVLAFHGNAMISRWMIPWAREFSRRTGATVVLPEYRGYDGLAGVPTYQGARLDADAALNAVREFFHVQASDMVFYGHSLGTAVATELASSNPPRVLLLESPFSSARAMAARWPVPGLGLVWPAISRVHYTTADRVAKLGVPVHVVHGERDIIVPSRMGRAVYAAAANKGALLLLPEAGHNDVATVGGDAYWKWVQAAIQSSSH
jgi:fermentation-respiration switch protein FrsA (DUF1100 family)